jgi:hypothetical protein
MAKTVDYLRDYHSWRTGCYCGHDHLLNPGATRVCDGPCAPHEYGTEGVK